MKRLCSICARGGSKGVPNKNLKYINGKPLIAYSIEQAKKTNLFSRISVSSDSPKILEIAKQYGADLLIQRPVEMATDTAPKLQVIQHCFLESERISKMNFDTVVDLDCTSPLRSVADILESVSLFESSTEATNLITGTISRRSPYFNMVKRKSNGYVELVEKLDSPIARRQDVPICLDMNASIYIWRRSTLLDSVSVLNTNTIVFEMPEERSLDIDSPLDFDMVSFLLEKKMNRFSLSKKNVLITGATGILGKVFCQGLADYGANIAMLDKDQTSLDLFAAELSTRFASKFVGYQCDITDEKEVIETIQKIENDFGFIHVLHNNAASKGKSLDDFFEPYEEFKLETWTDIMDVNVNSMFILTKHVGAHMLKNKISGSIIQTGSIYGVVAPDQRIYEGSRYLDRQISSPAIYSASKAAVVGLTNYLAAYWGAKGIRVNTLTPGGIESGQNEIFKQNYSARVPLNRMGRADELIGALVFLASDSSSYITGQNLIIDGGLTVW